MPKLHVTMRTGEQREIECRNGLTIMEAIRNTGFEDAFALCGGGCSCGTCHVIVADDWVGRVGPVGPFEDDMLDASPHRAPASRLSCQVHMCEALDGVRVTIAPAED